MAFTFTRTETKTFTRIELLKTQVSITLSYTTNLSRKNIESIFVRGIDKKWIDKIYIYGVDRERNCQSQLILDINWSEHEYQLFLGHDAIQVGERWEGDRTMSLDLLINTFNNHVSNNHLDTVWGFSYADGVNKDEANRVLGVTDGKAIHFKSKQTDGLSIKVPEISELTLLMKIFGG